MASLSLRDRFFTPRVARAIMSPSGILLAGAGTALGVLALGVTPVAAVVGAVAWAARVAAAMQRAGGPPGESIDPFRVGEPWRRFVLDAQQAQRRFDDTVRRMPAGPLQERMRSVGGRVTDAVRESWRIACQGDRLDGALRALDERTIRAEHAEALEERQRAGGNPSSEAAIDRTIQAIEAQLASAQRLRSVAVDAQHRLRLLNAQLDESVARAVEISLQSGDVTQLGTLGDDVENVVGELEALRSALEETSTVAGGTPGGTAGGTGGSGGTPATGTA